MSRYIDVTHTFLFWHGSPTGTQRVIQGISGSAQASGFKLAVLHPRKKIWFSIPAEDLQATFAPDLFVKSNRRLKGLLGSSQLAEVALRPIYRAFLHRLGKWAGLRAREGLLQKKGSPIQFASGDKIFIVDNCWGVPSFFTALSALKKRQPGLDIVGFIYDVTPLTHPQLTNDAAFIEEFTNWILQLVEISSYLLTDSQDAAREVVRVFQGEPTPAGRFRLSLPDGRTIFHRFTPRSVRFGSKIETRETDTSRASAREIIAAIESFGLPLSEERKHVLSESEDWALWVGTMMPRKNLEVQIDAFEPLWKSGSIRMPLFWVGRKGPGVEALLHRVEETPLLRSHVIILESVPDPLLWKLFRGARFSLYTSWTEGFGLPVSESLQRGCPVIASSGGSIPEVAGPLVDYFEPSDAGALRELILKYAQDASEYAQAKERARRFVPYSWSDTLEDMS